MASSQPGRCSPSTVLRALRQEPSADATAIRIANEYADEMAGSAVARNTFILLQQAIDRGGLPLTATGNLSRAVVTEMRELIKWPSYDQTDAFRLHKVINEPDFLPLHIVRLLAEAAKLVRTQRGQLVATPFGKSMLPPSPPMRATSRSSFGGKTRPASANKAR